MTEAPWGPPAAGDVRGPSRWPPRTRARCSAAKTREVGGPAATASAPNVVRSGISAPTTAIDRTRATGRESRMVTSGDPPPLSDLHILVLGRIAHRTIADVEDIARWLGVPVGVRGFVRRLEGGGPAHGSARPLRSRAGAVSTTLSRGRRSLVSRGRRHGDGAVPNASGASAPAKRRGPRSLTIVAPLLVVGLLRYPVTIDDHAAGA